MGDPARARRCVRLPAPRHGPGAGQGGSPGCPPRRGWNGASRRGARRATEAEKAIPPRADRPAVPAWLARFLRRLRHAAAPDRAAAPARPRPRRARSAATAGRPAEVTNFLDLADDLVVAGPEIRNGRAAVPDRIKVDEDRLQHYRLDV